MSPIDEMVDDLNRLHNQVLRLEQMWEVAVEFVAATCAFEADQFGPGWQERLGRRHLAWAALRGSCGYVEETDEL